MRFLSMKRLPTKTAPPTTKRTDGVRLKSGKVLYPRDKGYEEANIVKQRELDKKKKDETPSTVLDPNQPSPYNALKGQ